MKSVKFRENRETREFPNPTTNKYIRVLPGAAEFQVKNFGSYGIQPGAYSFFYAPQHGYYTLSDKENSFVISEEEFKEIYKAGFIDDDFFENKRSKRSSMSEKSIVDIAKKHGVELKKKSSKDGETSYSVGNQEKLGKVWDKVVKDFNDDKSNKKKKISWDQDNEGCVIIKESVVREKTDAKKVIKDLAKSYGKSNEDQGKMVNLIKGLAFSDDPEANKFMKALDKWTSSYAKKMESYQKEIIEIQEEIALSGTDYVLEKGDKIEILKENLTVSYIERKNAPAKLLNLIHDMVWRDLPFTRAWQNSIRHIEISMKNLGSIEKDITTEQAIELFKEYIVSLEDSFSTFERLFLKERYETFVGRKMYQPWANSMELINEFPTPEDLYSFVKNNIIYNI